MTKTLFDVLPWQLRTNKLHTSDFLLQESLTSIGNGYMGMRGNFEETYSGEMHKGTYLAGVWYPDKTKVGWWKNGYPDYFGKVVNAVDFIPVNIQINGVEIDLSQVTYQDFEQTLDMRTGELKRSYKVVLGDVCALITFKRFLSLAVKELSYQKISIAVIEGSATVTLKPLINGFVKNNDSNYDELFWKVLETSHKPLPYLTMITVPNAFGIEQFTVTAMMKNVVTLSGSDQMFAKESLQTDEQVAEIYQAQLASGESITLEKVVSVVTSRDILPSQQKETAESLVHKILPYDEALETQERLWEERWQLADVAIEGDVKAQQGIRFNLFQLFQTYYGDDARLNIGPKGFTGEKYGGATYWDTEAYAVPLYLALADPKVTRNLLEYRHNQLKGAKENAEKLGLRGALYPMVTFNGVECHNEWEITFEEIHRNGAIAYAIYNYTNYTGDTSYLAHEGLEVLVEIARFWASRVHYSTEKEQFMIHGVTGPNEYENNVNNNWYTNVLATWVLRYTKEAYEKYSQLPDFKATVFCSPEELAHWANISDNMYFPYDEKRQVFVQHDTFLDKELMPITELKESDRPLNQKWSWDHILRSCFIKQADVLQGIYFFGDHYSLAEKKRNYLFYEPMTVHESSLSPSIHAILAAEIGLYDKAMSMYERTARLDLDNINNDTGDGLHITSMTGSWLAIVQGFAQMRTWNGQLNFSPFLPKGWESYSFRILYRERLLKVTITETVRIDLLEGEPLTLTLYDHNVELSDHLAMPIEGGVPSDV